MKVFNTVFETSLRILLMLSRFNEPKSLDYLLAYDFICSYAKDFGITEYNLNGENSYKYGEINARRRNMKNALKRLVLDEYITVQNSLKGFEYRISEAGLGRCAELNSKYADEYSFAADRAIEKLKMISEQELLKMIREKSFSNFMEDEI